MSFASSLFVFSDRFILPETFTIGNATVLINVYDKISARLILETTFLTNHPKDIPGLITPVTIIVESIEILEDSVVEIRLLSERLALFVVLTTRAQGRFEENSFVLRPMESKVSYLFNSCIQT